MGLFDGDYFKMMIGSGKESMFSLPELIVTLLGINLAKIIKKGRKNAIFCYSNNMIICVV
jgi:hypothetical protein